MDDRTSANPDPRPVPPAEPRRGPYVVGSDTTSSRRRFWIVVGLLLFLIASAGVAARPAWRALRRVRSEVLAREAANWLGKEQWTLAFDRTRAALLLNIGNPTALRCAGRLYARLGVEAAIPYYESLLSTPLGTIGDREDLVELALSLGNVDLAAAHLSPLMDRKDPSARTLALAADRENRRGDRATALRYARRAFELDPNVPKHAFLMAAILAEGTRVSERDEAYRYLWPVASTNGPFQLRALEAILGDGKSPRRERERASQFLETNAPPGLEAQVLRYDARLGLDPSQGRELVDEAIRTLRPASDRELRVFAGWLVRAGFHAEALQLLGGPRALRDRGLFLLKYRALMESRSEEKAYNLLFQPGAPFSQLEIEAMRCQTAIAMADFRLRDSHLNAAVELAKPTVRAAVVVTRLAEMAGNPAPAIAVWRKLVPNRQTAGLALRQLAALADLQGDTVGARDFARQIVAEEPNNDAVRLAVALNDLLLGENIDAALAEAKAQFAKHPESNDLRGLVALGYLRRGEPAQADLALQGAIIRPEMASPGLLAIIAATLAANEDWVQARRIFDRIPLAALKAEEKELLRPFLGQESRLANPAAPR